MSIKVLQRQDQLSSFHDRIDRRVRIGPVAAFSEDRDVHGIGIGQRITGSQTDFARGEAGVDVQGEQLSCVIIDRLPFASPGDPLVKARIDAINQRGGSAFHEYQIPLATLALLQGLGGVPPAKALQMSALAFCQTFQGLAVRSRLGPCLNPLLSQPVRATDGLISGAPGKIDAVVELMRP